MRNLTLADSDIWTFEVESGPRTTALDGSIQIDRLVVCRTAKPLLGAEQA